MRTNAMPIRHLAAAAAAFKRSSCGSPTPFPLFPHLGPAAVHPPPQKSYGIHLGVQCLQANWRCHKKMMPRRRPQGLFPPSSLPVRGKQLRDGSRQLPFAALPGSSGGRRQDQQCHGSSFPALQPMWFGEFIQGHSWSLFALRSALLPDCLTLIPEG